MSNMSYCRFQNTLSDLADCAEAVEAREELSREESRARRYLFGLMANMMEEIGVTIDRDELERGIQALETDSEE